MTSLSSMTTSRVLVLGAFLLSAACTANTNGEDANGGVDTAAYRSSTHMVHSCMTSASGDELSGVVTWASVGISSRPSGLFISGSAKLDITDAEAAQLRESDPFTFTGGISFASGALEPNTGDTHFESADGTMELDLNLHQPHMLDHGVRSPGNATARVTIDFSAVREAIPARVRALGTQTFTFKLADCMQ